MPGNPVEPILQQLPDLSSLDNGLAPVLSSFGSISAKIKGFSLADLDSVLTSAGNLPIPDGLNMVEGTLNDLSRMEQLIPSDPGQLTATLQKGLQQLLTGLAGVNDIMKPLNSIIDFVAPVMEKYNFLNDTVERINKIITDLPVQANGLNLGSLPDQLEYLHNIFNVYPEAADVSPLKELKAQIDTFKTWMTSSTADLSAHFRDQIKTLADALPTQLNAVMQSGLDATKVIESPPSSLKRAVWYDPYMQALDAVDAINPDDLSRIDDYLAALDEQVTVVTEVAADLGKNAKGILENLNDFDANMFSQDLINAFRNIISTIGPEKPGIIAVIFHQIHMMISGLEVNGLISAVEQVDAEVEKLVGDLDVSAFTNTIKDTTDRIVGAVETVDHALVELATTLSSLVSELQAIIANVKLPDLMGRIQTSFSQLTGAANALLTQAGNVSGELTTFVDGIGQEIDNLNINALTEAIGGLLSDITSVLGAQEILDIREGAQKSIDEMVQNLEGITLTPVFDHVIEEMDDLKAELAAVDVSKLNDYLKEALKAALDVIRDIDFTSQVSDLLRGELKAILDLSTGLIEPVQEKFKEVVGQIDKFNPELIVSEKLSTPFEDLVEELNKIEPAGMLTPLLDLQGSLLSAMESLNPASILAPLDELHTRLTKALKSMSPHDLISPLNNLLGEVTGLLNELDLEEFITKIADSVGRINTLIGRLSPGEQIKNTEFWEILTQAQVGDNDLLASIENQLDQFLDRSVAHIPAIDMSVLQPALDGLSAGINSIKNHINAPEVLKRIEDTVTMLSSQNFGEGITELTQSWMAHKTRLYAVTPPPDLEEKYEKLKERLNNLSPIVLLAEPATLVERVEADLGAMQNESIQAKESLVAILTENQDKLDALLPDESTAEGFKMLLRETLDDQITKPIRDILHVVGTALQKFGGTVEKIKAVALKLHKPYEALTTLPDNIARIGDALVDAKKKITNINLNFLEDELQDIIDEVITQFDEVKPTEILAGLETFYQDALKAIRDICPDATIQSLDSTYQTAILGKIEALHPDKIVAEPLAEAFQDVLKLRDDLSADKIFDALNEKLATVDQELDEGIDRAGKAFNEILAALPL